MDEQQTSTPSPTSPPEKRGSGLRVLLVLAALFVVYQGVMYGVRRHVDGLIEENTGATLFDFELADLDGTMWRAADLRGKKVVLNFFRSKCQNCQFEASVIRELVRRVDPEEVVVLGLMMDRVQGFSTRDTQRTLVEFGYDHPVLMADEAFVEAFHGAGWANVTPVTYIADAEGRIVASLRGHQKLETLLSFVE